jgi:hypothetical protein
MSLQSWLNNGWLRAHNEGQQYRILTFDSAEKPSCFEKPRKKREPCQAEESLESVTDDVSWMVGVFWWSLKSLLFEKWGFSAESNAKM